MQQACAAVSSVATLASCDLRNEGHAADCNLAQVCQRPGVKIWLTSTVNRHMT